MIIDYFSSGSKFRRFYRFKDEAKLPIEEQTNNAQNMDTPNFCEIDESLPKNVNDEGKTFYDDANDVYENSIKNEKNEKENQHDNETETGNEKGQIMKDKLEEKFLQEQKTTIHSQKENTNENKN